MKNQVLASEVARPLLPESGGCSPEWAQACPSHGPQSQSQNVQEGCEPIKTSVAWAYWHWDIRFMESGRCQKSSAGDSAMVLSAFFNLHFHIII